MNTRALTSTLVLSALLVVGACIDDASSDGNNAPAGDADPSAADADVGAGPASDVGVTPDPTDDIVDPPPPPLEDAGSETVEDPDAGTEPPSDEGAPPDVATPPPDTTIEPDVPPIPTGDPDHTLVLPDFTVQVGKERQVCRMLSVPEGGDIDVKRFAATMTGPSHHFILYKMIDEQRFDPVPSNLAEVHDCSPAGEQLSGDAAYIFGSAEPYRELDMPPGVSFHLKAGQRLWLEQHVINYTGAPVTGSVTVDLFEADPAEVIEHHADIIWFGNWGWFLLPGMAASDTTHCTVPYAVEVIGLMSHFHERGTEFTIDKWTSSGTEPLYFDDDWAHPKFQEYDPPITLEAGEGLQWTCNWFNDTGDFILPGQWSTDEMCITFALAYPRDTLSGDPIQCNNF